MIDPWIHVSGKTPQSYQERPEAQSFSEQFWTVNEDEHGSGSPERLRGFALILSNEARTPEIDRDLLIPYFLRYLWQVPYPS